MANQTEHGRAIKMLTVINEYTRESLAIVAAWKIKSDDVLHCLMDLFIKYGPPEHIGKNEKRAFYFFVFKQTAKKA